MVYVTNKTVFDVNADCIVNPVNCDGFMGKGLALEFAIRYPELEKKYKEDCKNKKVKVGQINYYKFEDIKIINFPTKNHFKYPSKLSWIEQGLVDFIGKYKLFEIKRIAFPILGSSNGGLSSSDVLNLMEEYFANLDIEVIICKSKIRSERDEFLVRKLKNIDKVQLKHDLKINQSQIEAINKAKDEIYFFSELLQYNKIGIETYKKLYRYLSEIDIEEHNLFTI